jgi:hypothetical protein
MEPTSPKSQPHTTLEPVQVLCSATDIITTHNFYRDQTGDVKVYLCVEATFYAKLLNTFESYQRLVECTENFLNGGAGDPDLSDETRDETDGDEV